MTQRNHDDPTEDVDGRSGDNGDEAKLNINEYVMRGCGEKNTGGEVTTSINNQVSPADTYGIRNVICNSKNNGNANGKVNYGNGKGAHLSKPSLPDVNMKYFSGKTQVQGSTNAVIGTPVDGDMKLELEYPKKNACPLKPFDKMCFTTKEATSKLSEIRQKNNTSGRKFSRELDIEEVYQVESHYWLFCQIENVVADVAIYTWQNNDWVLEYNCILWQLRTKDFSTQKFDYDCKSDERTKLYGIGEKNTYSGDTKQKWELTGKNIKTQAGVIKHFEQKLSFNDGKRVFFRNHPFATWKKFGARIEDELPNAPRIDKPPFVAKMIKELKLNETHSKNNFETMHKKHNTKKYEDFVDDMNSFDGKFKTLVDYGSFVLGKLKNLLEELNKLDENLLARLLPRLFDTQIYIHRRKGVIYVEHVVYFEVKHPFRNEYYKYSAPFKNPDGKNSNYTCNCINTKKITRENVFLSYENDQVREDSFVAKMDNPHYSLFEDIGLGHLHNKLQQQQQQQQRKNMCGSMGSMGNMQFGSSGCANRTNTSGMNIMNDTIGLNSNVGFIGGNLNNANYCRQNYCNTGGLESLLLCSGKNGFNRGLPFLRNGGAGVKKNDVTEKQQLSHQQQQQQATSFQSIQSVTTPQAQIHPIAVPPQLEQGQQQQNVAQLQRQSLLANSMVNVNAMQQRFNTFGTNGNIISINGMNSMNNYNIYGNVLYSFTNNMKGMNNVGNNTNNINTMTNITTNNMSSNTSNSFAPIKNAGELQLAQLQENNYQQQQQPPFGKPLYLVSQLRGEQKRQDRQRGNIGNNGARINGIKTKGNGSSGDGGSCNRNNSNSAIKKTSINWRDEEKEITKARGNTSTTKSGNLNVKQGPQVKSEQNETVTSAHRTIDLRKSSILGQETNSNDSLSRGATLRRNQLQQGQTQQARYRQQLAPVQSRSTQTPPTTQKQKEQQSSHKYLSQTNANTSAMAISTFGVNNNNNRMNTPMLDSLMSNVGNMGNMGNMNMMNMMNMMTNINNINNIGNNGNKTAISNFGNDHRGNNVNVIGDNSNANFGIPNDFRGKVGGQPLFGGTISGAIQGKEKHYQAQTQSLSPLQKQISKNGSAQVQLQQSQQKFGGLSIATDKRVTLPPRQCGVLQSLVGDQSVTNKTKCNDYNNKNNMSNSKFNNGIVMSSASTSKSHGLSSVRQHFPQTFLTQQFGRVQHVQHVQHAQPGQRGQQLKSHTKQFPQQQQLHALASESASQQKVDSSKLDRGGQDKCVNKGNEKESEKRSNNVKQKQQSQTFLSNVSMHMKNVPNKNMKRCHQVTAHNDNKIVNVRRGINVNQFEKACTIFMEDEADKERDGANNESKNDERTAQASETNNNMIMNDNGSEKKEEKEQKEEKENKAAVDNREIVNGDENGNGDMSANVEEKQSSDEFETSVDTIATNTLTTRTKLDEMQERMEELKEKVRKFKDEKETNPTINLTLWQEFINGKQMTPFAQCDPSLCNAFLNEFFDLFETEEEKQMALTIIANAFTIVEINCKNLVSIQSHINRLRKCAGPERLREIILSGKENAFIYKLIENLVVLRNLAPSLFDYYMNMKDKKLKDLFTIYEIPVGAAKYKASVCTNGLSMVWYLKDFTMDSEITSLKGKELQREVCIALEREYELLEINNTKIIDNKRHLNEDALRTYTGGALTTRTGNSGNNGVPNKGTGKQREKEHSKFDAVDGVREEEKQQEKVDAASHGQSKFGRRVRKDIFSLKKEFEKGGNFNDMVNHVAEMLELWCRLIEDCDSNDNFFLIDNKFDKFLKLMDEINDMFQNYCVCMGLSNDIKNTKSANIYKWSIFNKHLLKIKQDADGDRLNNNIWDKLRTRFHKVNKLTMDEIDSKKKFKK